MPFSIRPSRRFPVRCVVTYNASPFLKLLLPYFFGFWSVTTLLLLQSGLAYAAWVTIDSTDDGVTLYADPDTIRRKEEMVKMWILFDFKTTQTVAGHLMLSIKGEEEYDCDEKRRRVLTFSEFSGNMGGGKEITSTSGEGSWVPVVPESVVQTLWTFACGKK